MPPSTNTNHSNNNFPGTIDVFLSPDTARECLTMSLHRTHHRADALVTDIVAAVNQPNPDPSQLRLLADGIQFESELAQELAIALADIEPSS